MLPKKWNVAGLILIFGMPSFAAIQNGAQVPERVTDDTEIYQNLSEIRSPKVREMQFHSDLHRLVALESRYHESLPRPRSYQPQDRLHQPIKKIQSKKYYYKSNHRQGGRVTKLTKRSRL